MNTKRNEITQRIARLERELEAAKGELSRMERECTHEWGETQAAHIRTEAYTIPGDPPGTMGVDWRGPVHVPAKTEQRWKRVCKKCGKEEFTTKTNKKTVETPRF